MVRRVRQERDHAAGGAGRADPLRGVAGRVPAGRLGRDAARSPSRSRRPATRYFLACRLKYSRWTWVRWTTDMRQETLFRGLVDCFCALGWVPWVLVFDNMKTVTSGRDAAGQPIWTPALLQLAGEFGFHPAGLRPRRGQSEGQRGIAGEMGQRQLPAGAHLRRRRRSRRPGGGVAGAARTRGPSAATGVPPAGAPGRRRRPKAGRCRRRPPTTGCCCPARSRAEALVAVLGNRYSVPVAHVGAPVTVRVHRDARAPVARRRPAGRPSRARRTGARQRVVDPAHFAPLFARKPRAPGHALPRGAAAAWAARAPAFLERALAAASAPAWREEVLRRLRPLRAATAPTTCSRRWRWPTRPAPTAPPPWRCSWPRPRPRRPPLPPLRAARRARRRRRSIGCLSVYEAWVHVDVARRDRRAWTRRWPS